MKPIKLTPYDLFYAEDINKLPVVIGGFPAVIAAYLRSLCKSYDIDTHDVQELGEQFGGNIYIVDCIEDLEAIEGTRLGTLTEEQTAALDICTTLDKGPVGFDTYERLGEYILVCLCTNNAGGHSYFIPKEFQTDNVKNSKGYSDD